MTDVAEPLIASIVELVRSLVQVPSRSPGDDLRPIQTQMQTWFEHHRLAYTVLGGPAGEPLGLYAEIEGRGDAGPWIVLDATLDTAPFGHLAAWTEGPTSGVTKDGWLYGRGSADSKSGAAMFAHLLAEWALVDPSLISGRLGVLLDLDEHSGGFGGARAFFGAASKRAQGRPDFVVIGYPGDHELVVGSRGFVRARLKVAGVAAHSGATVDRGINAVMRAAALAGSIASIPLPGVDPALGLPPQLTITGIEGGADGFSQVPDRCDIRLDVRLTRSFDDGAAREVVVKAVQEHDAAWRPAAPTEIEWIEGWPAYRVDERHPLVRAIVDAAGRELGRVLPTRVVGPSNIGNYLASLGIPAVAGFGVQGTGVHGTDERILLSSIAPVYRTYRRALQHLLVDWHAGDKGQE